jgi:hypothetical protein
MQFGSIIIANLTKFYGMPNNLFCLFIQTQSFQTKIAKVLTFCEDVAQRRDTMLFIVSFINECKPRIEVTKRSSPSKNKY